MKFPKQINCTSFSGGMLKRYIEGNGIEGAFVWREGPRHWRVLEGKPSEKTGFLAGEFKTKREAKSLAEKINCLILAAKNS